MISLDKWWGIRWYRLLLLYLHGVYTQGATTRACDKLSFRKGAPTRASNFCKQSVCTNILTVLGVVCTLAQTACVKSKQFDIFCASSQCLHRLSACFHKQTSVLLGVNTMWLCQLSLFVVQLTTLCLPKELPKNHRF